MRKSAQIIRLLNLGATCTGILLAIGFSQSVGAQERDPFAKPIVRTAKAKGPNGVPVKKEKLVPTVLTAPPIQQRIDNYRVLRARASELGLPAPKPTSALTVNEVEVNGIFRTPRGVAAMVEATPIKLSYTIYPGEKFYDGYLVAIEENRLVFRRETRMSDGKVSTVAENKGLKVQTVNDMLVPRVETATNQTAPTTNPTVTVPAAAVSATPQETVLTAEKKPKTKPAEKNTVETSQDSTNAESVKQPARKVNPRKSK
jgi:hypothetical protein